LTGVPLENDGVADVIGSHWEREFFPNELMTAAVELPPAISLFSIYLL
jgi:hypothetical protein